MMEQNKTATATKMMTGIHIKSHSEPPGSGRELGRICFLVCLNNKRAVNGMSMAIMAKKGERQMPTTSEVNKSTVVISPLANNLYPSSSLPELYELKALKNISACARDWAVMASLVSSPTA